MMEERGIGVELRQALDLPGVSQIGIVVEDLDKVIAYFESLGIGPFVRPNLKYVDIVQYGQPADYEFEIALAFCSVGNVEMELVQPISEPSIYWDFLRSKGEGLHHLGFDVDDIHARLERYRKMGIETILSGRSQTGEAIAAYLDTASIGGVYFELLQRKARRA
jgi:methylmalonyl-CoA/ethylmalonyl-CoA epimerase